MSEINDIINNAKGRKNGIPTVTSYDKEVAKKKKNKIFKNKIFLLSVDEGSEEYSEFMTSLIQTEGTEILREDSSWTQHGELIRSIDYLETE